MNALAAAACESWMRLLRRGGNAWSWFVFASLCIRKPSNRCGLSEIVEPLPSFGANFIR